MLFKKDLERFIEKIYQDLVKDGYKMSKNTLSNFNIDINMDNMNNVKNDTENFISFKSMDGNINIDITKEAITMIIEYNEFSNFEKFAKVFNMMQKKLKNIRIGFSFNRIGIRKINAWLIKDIKK